MRAASDLQGAAEGNEDDGTGVALEEVNRQRVTVRDGREDIATDHPERHSSRMSGIAGCRLTK